MIDKRDYLEHLEFLVVLGFISTLVSCAPRVATSFWKIGTPADSIRPGYTIIYAEGKTRHCYPITEWLADPKIDTYHQLHHHGVAVESDEMAYRIYFDRKQTIDIYAKRTPRLELGTSYWYPNDSLLSSHYGDDILRVSGTVGVGSVKYWNGTKQVHIEPVEKRSQRIVSQSRNAATIEVAVKGWKPLTAVSSQQSVVSDQPSVDMVTQYTMRAGHRDMRCDVYLSEAVEGLCTGVQTIPAKKSNPQSVVSSQELDNGILLYSWGTDWPVNDSAKYAKETVGLAVFIPKEYAREVVSDKSNLLCLLKQSAVSGQQAAHFYLTCVGATKEDKPVATNAEEWKRYLLGWSKRLK